MKPTDVTDPSYFHRVVDCQWACPAHTPVPAYIRLIAQGRYSDAYLLNRASNVFPGVLGRVCDRPCEPACRRTRVDGEPVAICRLKRVAADHRDDIADRLPKKPPATNGKRIALVGAGPASFTVANDLAPLGYECVIFEKHAEPGGLMRTNIPAFRLPEQVLAEELGYILDMGVELRLNAPVESMKALLDEGWDAVFVGSGAPKGKDLNLPGRDEASERIHIGIDWLESVAFDHIDAIGENVLIIGVGNTAMDCCRTSLRLGARNVKVMARKPRAFFKASDWELEDAEEENVAIVVNHAPKAFVVEDGRLVGMTFAVMEYDLDAAGRIVGERAVGEETFPCDDVILAIGQENAFPWIEDDAGIAFDKWRVPEIDPTTFESARSGVFFGGDAAFGPKNIIWAVEHGHQAAISIHRHCQRLPLTDREPDAMALASSKMGMAEWRYDNAYTDAARRKMRHVELVERFEALDIEVELGFDAEQIATEVERCLNCDMHTVFDAPLCEECDACLDVCPVECLSIAPNADDPSEIRAAVNASEDTADQAVFVSAPLPLTGRVMLKDENICLHCGLCAERCPTAAWDMQEGVLRIHYAASQREGCDV